MRELAERVLAEQCLLAKRVLPQLCASWMNVVVELSLLIRWFVCPHVCRPNVRTNVVAR